MSFAQSFANWQADRAEFGPEICDDCGSEIYPDQDGCALYNAGANRWATRDREHYDFGPVTLTITRKEQA